MAILAWQIKETRHVAAHAEHVVNELLIVKYLLNLVSPKCFKKISF